MRTTTSIGLGRLRAAVVALLLSLACHAADGLAAATNPVVEGPIGGGLRGRPWESSLFDVAPFGYVEEEYFISGVATNNGELAFFASQQTPLALSAPYKTRIIVRRPADPAKFSGTVVVEWLNVTGQNDLEVAWPVSSAAFIREGFAYVGVSAQQVGVCCAPGSLKVWDPVRYATLLHPGDSFSYEMFSQAIQALRDPANNRTTILNPAVVDPMGGEKVERVIATGASQSAAYLTTYINDGFHAGARVIDGFIIARGGGPYPNLDTPVLQINEEGNFSTRQPDGAVFVLWEEAGAAHAPLVWWQYSWAALSRDLTGTPLPDAVNIACSVNHGTSQYTSNAGGHWMNEWLKNGTPPPSAPRLMTDASGNIVRDANGLALGGLRHPFVQVPLALNYGAGNAGAPAGCPLWGSYEPWSREKILSLYPSKADYVSLVDDWVDYEVTAGFLLQPDADEIKAKAAAFDVWDAGSCYDTLYPSANESGPVSSALHGLAYDTLETSVGFGAASAVHEGSCEVAVPLGL